MATISEIFRTFSPEYVDRFGDSMPQEHRKAMNAIIDCRTEAAGIAVYECQECGKLHRVNRSCGNRHCPTCQNHKTSLHFEQILEATHLRYAQSMKITQINPYREGPLMR